MERQLCRGYMRLALALARAGDIASRAAPFNLEEHVYEQRFYYFHALPTPAYIHYQDYLLSTAAAGGSPLTSCDAIAKHNLHPSLTEPTL